MSRARVEITDLRIMAHGRVRAVFSLTIRGMTVRECALVRDGAGQLHLEAPSRSFTARGERCFLPLVSFRPADRETIQAAALAALDVAERQPATPTPARGLP